MHKIFIVCLAVLVCCLPIFRVEAAAAPQPENKFLTIDSDRDGLNDAWEKILGTDPLNPDTDGDSYADGVEVAQGFDPLNPQPVQLEKLIKVNIKTQTLVYYFGGKKLEEFLISSGVAGMATPKGEFKILDKVPSKNYGGKGYNFYFPNTKWNLHFYTGKLRFYIHGAYWHNNFGHPMSHGCVNVSYANMERLYNWAQVGTKVIIN
ncbi:MAG: L,D-transpeptidase family protein [Candidatus Falkowbacteria bacterium]